MPIRVKTDLEWGDLFYLRADPDQLEHHLVAVTVCPGNQIRFRLSHQGDECEVWDFEATREPDEVKRLNNQKGSE